ncbi:hypothetical protein F443_07090 [Phytophthora nicotianae P1569]|uniref:DUF6818 domain-containing protein n=1 Tax=Phytophthora nicotianae P1569 TaxID=1317065 RepID=V9FBX2_PHYNI|nr:hypothetical protein F443_07090 [Phytophthora nicotianae P1569]
MVKATGSSNYMVAEIDRLLSLVEEFLPLGQDEWERLAGFYNVTRVRGWQEREYESLRRKFKVLYSTRKPTGIAEMPPHIKRAKALKDAIDEKTNVVVMDDGADEEQQDFQPDFSFEVDPDDDDDLVSAGDVPSETGDVGGFGQSGTAGIEQTGGPQMPIDGSFQEMLASALAGEMPDPTTDTPRPVPAQRSGPNTRARMRTSVASAPTGNVQTPRKPATRSRAVTDGYKYERSSNRLGGTDLTAIRDEATAKRTPDSEMGALEASYAKSKRLRAVKATTALKTKLEMLETSSSAASGSMLETILLLREENERKAELRRQEEDQRRRDEAAAREARYQAEKTEAEERHRQDRLDNEDRARRNKEEARARTQEHVLLIGTLIKKP